MAFNALAQSLKTGETGVLISHGDPIAWLANTLGTQNIPISQNLRELRYPAKGEGLVAVLDPNGDLFTIYRLNEDSVVSTQKRIY